LLKVYGTDLEGEGSPQLKVTNRSGKKVAVHCHPSQGFWPQALVLGLVPMTLLYRLALLRWSPSAVSVGS